MKHEFSIVCRYLEARPKQVDAENVLFEFEGSLQGSQFVDSLCSKMNTLLKRTERMILNWIEQSDGSFWIWKKFVLFFRSL